MFRIVQDPSSGSLVHYLAKITIMVLSYLSTEPSYNFIQVLYKAGTAVAQWLRCCATNR